MNTNHTESASHEAADSASTPDLTTFDGILRSRLSRRDAIRGRVGSHGARKTPVTGLGFTGIQPQKISDDAVRVPAGYSVDVLLRRGDAVVPGAPAFDGRNQSAASQAMQCGYNHDFQAFFPIGDGVTEGVFWVNHE